MSRVKGFILIPALQINTPGQNSQFGELSQLSETFSREQGVYRISTDTLLRSFCSKNTSDIDIVVPTAVSEVIGLVAQSVYNLFSTDQMGSIDDVDELVTIVNADIPVDRAMALVFENKIVSTVPGQTNYWMPGSATFYVLDGGNRTDVTVWFTNTEFEAQYDEYEIVVIPPVITNVDELNTTPANIHSLITNATSFANILPKINTAKGSKPPTTISNFIIQWNDPSGTSSSVYATPWVFLTWGPKGELPQNIRNAIKDYIDENSNLSQTIWQIIYPELFASMEFYIIPYYDKIAIPEMGPNSGLNSPIISDYTTINDRAVSFAAGLTPGQVQAGSSLLPVLFKSLLTIAVGNPSNTDGKVKIQDVYGTYILAPTDHADFDRMGPITTDFVLKLNQSLAVAETATSSSPVPNGFSRETRQSKRYIAFTTNGVDVLVLTKESLLGGI